MRNIRLFFFVGIVLFFGGQSLYSQSKKERKEQKAKEIKEMIENGRFTIKVDRALPMGGRTVNLTTPYSLEMRGRGVCSILLLRSQFSLVCDILPISRRYAYNRGTI